MKKLLLIMMVVVLVLVMATGCGNSSSGGNEGSGSSAGSESNASSSQTAETSVKIGLSMGTTTNLFYSKMVEIIQKRCDELGIELVITDEDHDLSKQISSIENFISMKCTAIMLVAFDPEGITETVQKAVDEGIYVMTYDGFVEGAQGSLNLDNYEYGYATGTLAADWVNSNSELKAQKVIEAGIFDYPDIVLIIERAKGINDALAKLAPNVKVVAQQKAGVGDEGNVQAENFLQAHPNIQIMCGINDTGILGAYEVFTAEGHIGDNIGLFGADGDPQALELISEGAIYRGTVMSGAYEIFPDIVDMMKDASEGNPPEDGNIIYPVTPVDPSNVKDYLTE